VMPFVMPIGAIRRRGTGCGRRCRRRATPAENSGASEPSGNVPKARTRLGSEKELAPFVLRGRVFFCEAQAEMHEHAKEEVERSRFKLSGDCADSQCPLKAHSLRIRPIL
jgi:hypothetical protein